MRLASKEEVRRGVWHLLKAKGVVQFPGATGRIPKFVGAEAAARWLAELAEWKRARTLKCNPDLAQLPVRKLAFRQGKRVFMAVPRLAEEKCYIELRGNATIKGATKSGRRVHPRGMSRIDFVVAGSVAVRRDGARLGKGGGFCGLEFGMIQELGLVGKRTTVATTVHPHELTRARFPMLVHDLPLDLIVTFDETIRCPRTFPRPSGVYWSLLPAEKLAEIPVLARRRPHGGPG